MYAYFNNIYEYQFNLYLKVIAANPFTRRLQNPSLRSILNVSVSEQLQIIPPQNI